MLPSRGIKFPNKTKIAPIQDVPPERNLGYRSRAATAALGPIRQGHRRKERQDKLHAAAGITDRTGVKWQLLRSSVHGHEPIGRCVCHPLASTILCGCSSRALAAAAPPPPADSKSTPYYSQHLYRSSVRSTREKSLFTENVSLDGGF